MSDEANQVGLQPMARHFTEPVVVSPVHCEGSLQLFEAHAPIEVAHSLLALKRFRGLGAMARTPIATALPYWGGGKCGTGEPSWLLPTEQLEPLDPTGSHDQVPDGQSKLRDLAVVFVPASSAEGPLIDSFPGASGVFLFVPDQANQVRELKQLTINDLSWGVMPLSAGDMSPIGLAEDGTLTVQTRQSQLNQEGPAGAGDPSISVTGADSGSPSAVRNLPSAPSKTPERELARAANVTYYKRITVGRGKQRAAVWKRFRYDELVVTDQRLIFSIGGNRQQQLSIDPEMAARGRTATSGVSGVFALSDDVAAQIPFVTDFTPRTFIFRPILMPAKLRMPLWVITFFFSLVLIGTFGVLALIVPVATAVLIFMGLPAPWPGILIKAWTASLGASPFRSVFSYGNATKLYIPDPVQRDRITNCVVPLVQEVNAALRG